MEDDYVPAGNFGEGSLMSAFSKARSKTKLTSLKGDMNAWLKRRGHIVRAELPPEQRRDIRECFDMLDEDGSGQLDSDELHAAFKILGMPMHRSQVDMLIKNVDPSGDGELDFKEFEELISSASNLKEKEATSVRTSDGEVPLPFDFMAIAFRRKKMIEGISMGGDIRTRLANEANRKEKQRAEGAQLRSDLEQVRARQATIQKQRRTNAAESARKERAALIERELFTSDPAAPPRGSTPPPFLEGEEEPGAGVLGVVTARLPWEDPQNILASLLKGGMDSETIAQILVEKNHELVAKGRVAAPPLNLELPDDGSPSRRRLRERQQAQQRGGSGGAYAGVGAGGGSAAAAAAAAADVAAGQIDPFPVRPKGMMTATWAPSLGTSAPSTADTAAAPPGVGGAGGAGGAGGGGGVSTWEGAPAPPPRGAGGRGGSRGGSQGGSRGGSRGRASRDDSPEKKAMLSPLHEGPTPCLPLSSEETEVPAAGDAAAGDAGLEAQPSDGPRPVTGPGHFDEMRALRAAEFGAPRGSEGVAPATARAAVGRRSSGGLGLNRSPPRTWTAGTLGRKTVHEPLSAGVGPLGSTRVSMESLDRTVRATHRGASRSLRIDDVQRLASMVSSETRSLITKVARQGPLSAETARVEAPGRYRRNFFLRGPTPVEEGSERPSQFRDEWEPIPKASTWLPVAPPAAPDLPASMQYRSRGPRGSGGVEWGVRAPWRTSAPPGVKAEEGAVDRASRRATKQNQRLPLHIFSPPRRGRVVAAPIIRT